MTTPAPLRPATVLAQLFVSSRPVSWINTAYPFAAAYLLTARQIDLTFVVGTLFFLVPYNLAMYGVNDVFDYESDLRNPRKGGAHGAILDRRLHRVTLWAAALSCLPFLVYLVLVGSWPATLVLAASMFFVVFYSAPPLRLKERPFADSVTSSIHFFSPAVYGLVLAGATWTWPLGAIVAAFALWPAIARHTTGDHMAGFFAGAKPSRNQASTPASSCGRVSNRSPISRVRVMRPFAREKCCQPAVRSRYWASSSLA